MWDEGDRPDALHREDHDARIEVVFDDDLGVITAIFDEDDAIILTMFG